MTNFFSKILGRLLVGAGLCAGSLSPASAEVIRFYDGSNLFATLTTSEGTTFSLYFDGVGTASGAYLDYINMAGPNGTCTNTTNASITTVSCGSYDADGFNDAGRKGFNWQIQFPNSNTDRLTKGETATWQIVITDPNVWDFSLLHINAYNAAGGSIKLDGCVVGDTSCGPCGPNTPGCNTVPEPGPLALLGAGLVGLALIRRRRRE